MKRIVLLASCMTASASFLHAEPLKTGPIQGESGLFSATLSCDLVRPVLNVFQACDVHVAPTAAETPEIDNIAVDARVPGLGRVMPTAPRARRTKSNGDYRIEGLKFDMAGRWRLALDIGAGARHDRLAFDIDVK